MSEPTFELSPESIKKIAIWALERENCFTSQAIAAVALGIKKDKCFLGFDPYSFERCYRLIQLIPELRNALPLVAKESPCWGPIADAWDELVRLYLMPYPRDFSDKLKSLESA